MTELSVSVNDAHKGIGLQPAVTPDTRLETTLIHGMSQGSMEMMANLLGP